MVLVNSQLLPDEMRDVAQVAFAVRPFCIDDRPSFVLKPRKRVFAFSYAHAKLLEDSINVCGLDRHLVDETFEECQPPPQVIWQRIFHVTKGKEQFE